MGLAQAAKEAIYLKRFLSELGSNISEPITIHNDNQGAQKLALNQIYHNRTKHIDIKHHFVREAVKSGVIVLEYLPTGEMLADILTKGLPGSSHRRWIGELGLN